MTAIPSQKDNPNGLHQRYVVTKANGEPVDPMATYFVLRLDSFGRDGAHIAACRCAARAYVGSINYAGAKHLERAAEQLLTLVENFDQADGVRNDQSDKIDGHLFVGTNDRGQVVINLDHDRTGHIVFSPDQARGLASLLQKHADAIDAAK